MVFHRSLSDSKSLQVSRTFPSIQVDLNNAVVWMVSARLSIFNSSSFLTKLLETIPSTPITIGITVTFIFDSFFNSLARTKYLFYSFESFSQQRWRCLWYNGYRRRKWTRWHEFKSWTRMIAFHIALIPLGKVWIQLFSLQLWVNSRAD